MSAEQILQSDINKIIDIARFAPSVHNTQPWKVSVKNSAVVIKIDKSISLKYSDPTGRETYISLGIFTEAIIIAAKISGLKVGRVILNKNESVIEFVEAGKNPDAETKKLISCLHSRCTDRSIFTPIQISEKIISKIESCFSLPGVTVKVVIDRSLIDKMAELTSKGIGLALSNPDFREELSGYLTLPFSKKKRGISVLSLRIPTLLAILEPKLIRHGIGLHSEVKVEKKRWLSASAIIFITTRGDIGWDWFCAGRAYLRTSLVAEEVGLSQATSAATVEASTFHEDVEKMLGTQQRLQCVTRLGQGSSKKIFSPREPAEVLLPT
jgi:hypothetical protein